MQNQFIYPQDIRRIRPGFGGFGRPGFGRPGFGRPGFGFGGAGLGLGLGLLGGFATGALLGPALYGGYGVPPFGFY
ncbi:spore coat protein [Niallia sp. HCP3S3_B10]|uniref:spore coat protein n=1 Tax=Niallia sp. HCP3S3_B10 TaxID=3438944 RepID=UPI003F891ED1